MFNCAIVGCGKIGVSFDSPNDSNIRTHLKSYLDNKECKLVAVCDPDLKKLKQVTSNWKKIKSYTCLEKLLEENPIDVLSICSPTEKHFENFDLACKAGVKKIWLEKPSAENSNLTKKMIQIKNKFGVKVFVNYPRRYDPSFIELKNELVNIGNLVSVSGFYTKGLRNNASHLIDLLIWLIGPIESQNLTSNFQGRKFPSASFNLRFKNIDANIKSLNYKNFEMFELDIIGSSGRIIINDSGRRIDFYKISESEDYHRYKILKPYKSLKFNSYGFMKNGLELFLNSQTLPSLEDDFNVQKVVDSLSKDLIS
ncbi:MAG: hypothetical protein CMP33_04105 [Rickettsiales bacterium]|nr:hypothetical protein [Rickettsiales bacterium]